MDPQTATLIVGIASTAITGLTGVFAARYGAIQGAKETAKVTKESQDRQVLISEWRNSIELYSQACKMVELVKKDDLAGFHDQLDIFRFEADHHTLASVAPALYQEYRELETATRATRECAHLLEPAHLSDSSGAYHRPVSPETRAGMEESVSGIEQDKVRELLKELPVSLGAKPIYPIVKDATLACLKDCQTELLVVNALFRRVISMEMPYGFREAQERSNAGMYTPPPPPYPWEKPQS